MLETLVKKKSTSIAIGIIFTSLRTDNALHIFRKRGHTHFLYRVETVNEKSFIVCTVVSDALFQCSYLRT